MNKMLFHGRVKNITTSVIFVFIISLVANMGGLGYCDVVAETNVNEEIEKLLKDANSGMPEAQYTLGKMYLLGKSVERNEVEAAIWIKKSAESGIANAQYLLGDMYASGKGVKPDKVLAYKWFHIAESNGHPQAGHVKKYIFKYGMSAEQKAQAMGIEKTSNGNK